MNKQEKIDFIYELMADKSLTFGCVFYHKPSGGWWKYQHIREGITLKPKDIIIRGHDIYIGDVLRLYCGSTTAMRLIPGGLWRYLDKPIDEQPYKCICFVLSLFRYTPKYKSILLVNKHTKYHAGHKV